MWGGVCSGGLPGPEGSGMSAPRGCTWSGEVSAPGSGGVSAPGPGGGLSAPGPGGVCSRSRGCQVLPPCEQNDKQVQKYNLAPNFVCGR